jgi:hypothetical protein
MAMAVKNAFAYYFRFYIYGSNKKNQPILPIGYAGLFDGYLGRLTKFCAALYCAAMLNDYYLLLCHARLGF